jgi:hypothetical protein
VIGVDPHRDAHAQQGFSFCLRFSWIVFRLKYPRWWYDWNLELLRFSNRSASISR